MIINRVLGREGGEEAYASIFITGLQSTDTLSCSTPSGETLIGEWVTKTVQTPYAIPTMTSNTTPAGTASANQYSSSYLSKAYLAFDGNDSTMADVYYGSAFANGTYTRYQFAGQVVVTAVSVAGGVDGSSSTSTANSIQALINGTWVDVASNPFTLSNNPVVTESYEFDTPVTCNGIAVGSTASGNGRGVIFRTIQVEGYTESSYSGWEFESLDEYGTYTVTATRGSDAITENVLIDAADDYEIPMKFITYLPIGGRIFYIYNDNGATYEFYDTNKTVLPTQTVAGLASAVYYSIEGTKSADKFYVYDTRNGMQSGKNWGKSGTLIGANADGVGAGKTNTNRALGYSGWESTSIFTYISSCRNSNLGGCNDWFVGSKTEQDCLRSSGLVSQYTYSGNSILSSVEYTSTSPYFFFSTYQQWRTTTKVAQFQVIALRSF